MAKGENAKKKGNRKEWWGKRPMAYCDSGRPGDKTNKRTLHKLERLEGKLEIGDRMSEDEGYSEEEIEANLDIFDCHICHAINILECICEEEE